MGDCSSEHVLGNTDVDSMWLKGSNLDLFFYAISPVTSLVLVSI